MTIFFLEPSLPTAFVARLTKDVLVCPQSGMSYLLFPEPLREDIHNCGNLNIPWRASIVFWCFVHGMTVVCFEGADDSVSIQPFNIFVGIFFFTQEEH